MLSSCDQFVLARLQEAGALENSSAEGGSEAITSFINSPDNKYQDYDNHRQDKHQDTDLLARFFLRRKIYKEDTHETSKIFAI